MEQTYSTAQIKIVQGAGERDDFTRQKLHLENENLEILFDETVIKMRIFNSVRETEDVL